MENLKTKGIFTLLFTLTIFLTMAFGNVFATTEYIPVYVNVKTANGTQLKAGTTYTNIKAGDKIYVTAYCNDEKAIYWSQNSYFMNQRGYKLNDKGMAILAYAYDDTPASEATISSDPTQMVITIPNFEPGSTHLLSVQGVGAVDYLTQDGITYEATSGWIDIKFTIPKAEPLTGDISASYNGKTLLNGSTTTISKGEKVTISGSPAANFASVSGSWQIGNNAATPISFKGASSTLEIPGEEGQTIKLTLTGTLKDGGKTSTKTYVFKIPSQSVNGNVSVVHNGTTLKINSTTIVNVGDKVQIKGIPAESFKTLGGKWLIQVEGSDLSIISGITVNGASTEINIPIQNDKQTVTLHIAGTLKDGNSTASQAYIFKMKSNTDITEPEIPEEPEEPETPYGSVKVKMNNKTLSDKSTNIVDGDEELRIVGTPVDYIDSIRYKWDDGNEQNVEGNSIDIPVIAEEGVTHTLTVYGALIDGNKTNIKTFYFEKEKEEELIVEPWMREDSEAEGLIVSLRNDSESEKANKNFYMLDEEIIYYVDYKNCGKEISNEVKLVLELPLKFAVVESESGAISHNDKTITWTFENGLDEGEAGTKEVIIKYTDLKKKSSKYEIVYPQANIYRISKKMDSSTVINYIYLDEETEIKEEHEPYMFGDKDTPTFRPDDTITRAEGALVLTRIFGIDTSGTKVTNKYSDINETYLEAQRAISAATELGIIEGYEDGTYRPNEKMTRAEFMKIIASYIEVVAEDKDIEGLEVKDGSNIKVYKNPYIKNHWASNYVTLLARLNMTSVSSKNKDLRLNDEITRAEVAQLVNFYSFRAPVDASKSTKTDFIDVSRNHDLFEDIVEATRDTHTYYITEEGKEL